MLLEWVAISFSRGSSQPRDWTWVSCIAGRFFTDWATREATDLLISKLFVKVKVKIAQSCPTLCEPMDDKVHGILQARIPESVAFPFSRRSSKPRDQIQVSCVAGRFFTSWARREALWLLGLLKTGAQFYYFISQFHCFTFPLDFFNFIFQETSILKKFNFFFKFFSNSSFLILLNIFL